MADGGAAAVDLTPSLIDPAHRIRALDGLRAIAVGLVAAFHAMPGIFPGGFIGVDIFFVISGFVITGSLCRDGVNLRRFYIHRLFRIFPPMIPVVLFCMMLALFGWPWATKADVAYALLSLMNWARAFGVTDGHGLGHFWSLSLEEQFYLLWPATLLLLLRRPSSLVFVLGTIIVAAIGWQNFLWLATDDYARVIDGLDTRISQILIGCLLSFVVPGRPLPTMVLVVGFMLLAVATLTITMTGPFYLSVGIGLVALVSAAIIAGLVAGDSFVHRLLEMPLMQWAGSRSYALYLWHFPLLQWFLELGRSAGMRAPLPIVASAVLTCVMAELSQRLIERPSRSWRKQFDGSTMKALA